MDQETKAFYESFKTETVYLWNDLNETFLKVESGKCFAKLKCGKEFEINIENSRLLDYVMEPQTG